MDRADLKAVDVAKDAFETANYITGVLTGGVEAPRKNDTIEFQGKEYPVRDIDVPEFGTRRIKRGGNMEILLKQIPLDGGLFPDECIYMLKLLRDKGRDRQIIPVDIQGENAAASGFMTAKALEALDYDQEGLSEFIKTIIDNTELESPDGLYGYKGVGIFMDYQGSWIKTDDLQYCRKLGPGVYKLVEAVEHDDGYVMHKPGIVDLSEWADPDTEGLYSEKCEDVIRTFYGSIKEFEESYPVQEDRDQILAELIYETFAEKDPRHNIYENEEEIKKALEKAAS